MLKKEIREELEEAEFVMKLNLENNYRELAYQNFLEYVMIIKKYKDKNLIKEKDLNKLEQKASDYQEMFVEDASSLVERGKIE